MITTDNLESHTKPCEKEFHCRKCHTARVSFAATARLAVALTIFLALPAASRSATIALGGISFNTLIPSGAGVAGVTNFEVDNFTGLFALPSDFPAVANLIFENSKLVLTEQGGAQDVISLGALAPGANTPTLLDFSSTLNFVSAAFTATLSSQTFALSDGTTFEASSSQISSEVTPSSGSTLSPDIDFSLIVVSGTSVPTTIPEPRELALTLIALAGVIAGRLRRQGA
jgi:hypothetical protein